MGRLAKWNRGASRVALRDTSEPPSGFDAVTVYASTFVKSAPPRPSTPAKLRTNASETEWDLTDKRTVPRDDVFVTTAAAASPPPKAAYPRPPPGQPHRSKVILAHDPRPARPARTGTHDARVSHHRGGRLRRTPPTPSPSCARSRNGALTIT